MKLCPVFFLFLCLFGSPLQADLATVHLNDGSAHTIEFLGMTPAMVEGKANSRPDTPIQRFTRDRIAYVDFPTTEEWRNAESAFESGRFAEAIRLYQQVIQNPQVHYFPLPGNFVSLAQVRILECQRRRMDPKAVADQAAVVRDHFLRLPPKMRVIPPVVEAWKAVADKKWEQVVEALKEVETPGPEMFFLRGVALESLGKKEEALQEYAGAYILNFGGGSNLTKQALKRSAMLLASLGEKDRLPELQAQVKIYRDLFGEGQLWEGAPEWVVKLANEEIDTLAMEVEGEFEKPESMETDSGTVVAENSADATLPPLEERDWILVHETAFPFAIVGVDPKTSPPVLEGDVVQGDEGFHFKEGGAVKMPPVDGTSLFWSFLLQFTPQTKDGVVFDIGPKGKGVGLYLKGGDIILAWSPNRGAPVREKIGVAEPGKVQKIYFHSKGDGILGGHCNREQFTVSVPKKSLGLEGNYAVFLGDSGSGEGNAGAADGEEHVPFQGKIAFFSLGATTSPDVHTANRGALYEKQTVRLYPPEEREKAGKAKKQAPKKDD